MGEKYELWDAYDGDMNPLGFDLVRGEPMDEGVFHVVCEVILRHADGEYLLMKRHPEKPVYPGYWELTAGGSALKGETPLDCVVRELSEETGILCRDFTLTDRLNIRWSDFGAIFFEYFAVTDCPKDSVTLQVGETVDYRWVDKPTLEAMFAEGLVIPSLRKRHAKFFASPLYK